MRCILMIERAEVLTHVTQAHSCAVLSEGDVKCWGSGTSGQVIRNVFFLILLFFILMFVFARLGD